MVSRAVLAPLAPAAEDGSGAVSGRAIRLPRRLMGQVEERLLLA